MSISISLFVTSVACVIVFIGVILYNLFGLNLQPVSTQLITRQAPTSQVASSQPATIQLETYNGFTNYIKNQVLTKYDKDAVMEVYNNIEKKNSSRFDVNIKALIAAANLLTLIGQEKPDAPKISDANTIANTARGTFDPTKYSTDPYAGPATAYYATNAATSASTEAVFFAASAAYYAGNAVYYVKHMNDYIGNSFYIPIDSSYIANQKVKGEVANIATKTNDIKNSFIYAAGIIYLHVADLLKEDADVFKQTNLAISK